MFGECFSNVLFDGASGVNCAPSSLALSSSPRTPPTSCSTASCAAATFLRGGRARAWGAGEDSAFHHTSHHTAGNATIRQRQKNREKRVSARASPPRASSAPPRPPAAAGGPSQGGTGPPRPPSEGPGSPCRRAPARAAAAGALWCCRAGKRAPRAYAAVGRFRAWC